MNDLPDIQHSEKPEHEYYINQVGVQNVKVPFLLRQKSGGLLALTANVTMTTDLKSDIKGISMSMLLRTLMNYLDVPLNNKLIKIILTEFRSQVETNSLNSMLRFNFEYPLNKEAPISKLTFPQYYNCSFEGRLDENQHYKFFEKVIVSYASYCPCSVSLCEHAGEGFPHAQRSFAEVTIETVDTRMLHSGENIIWLEDLVYMVEDAVKTSPYPILRRVDEQWMAKTAGKNPMFVEDAIRRIIHAIKDKEGISDWIIKTTHQESIHTSDAISVAWKGVKWGFDGSFYL